MILSLIILLNRSIWVWVYFFWSEGDR